MESEIASCKQLKGRAICGLSLGERGAGPRTAEASGSAGKAIGTGRGQTGKSC